MLNPKCSPRLPFILLSPSLSAGAIAVTAFWDSRSFPLGSPGRVMSQTSGDTGSTWMALCELAAFTLPAVINVKMRSSSKNKKVHKKKASAGTSDCDSGWIHPRDTVATLRSSLGSEPQQRPQEADCSGTVVVPFCAQGTPAGPRCWFRMSPSLPQL